MSYQVGVFCYATPVDAGAAACGRFTPVSAVTSGGDFVVTVSCEGVNPDTGALQLQVASTPTSGAGTTYKTVEQMPVLFPCQHQDYLDAFSSVFWVLVSVIVVPYCLFRLYQKFLDLRTYRSSE
jgi:hypothetical protein